MADDKFVNIDCPVDLPEGAGKFGKFANAFRIVPESGQECFLDFCVYSAQENRAMVVARIRIHRSFLPIILGRLAAELKNLTPQGPAPVDGFKVEDGVVKTTDGRLVFFRTPEGEQ